MKKNKILTIAEVGQAHDGSLGIAHSFIDALSKTGVDIIKFQTHIAEAESSDAESFRTNFSYEDKNRYDYWKRMEFSKDQWIELKKHCQDVGLEFLSTPSSIAAVNLLEEVGVDRYKVGSGDISNNLLLNKLSLINKPIILSSGMSTIEELKEAMGELNKISFDKISILQCTSRYPTQAHEIGLDQINNYKKIFNCQVGYSDHSGNKASCLAAVALGAEILEFHVTFDKKMFGPDSGSSIEIRDIPSFIKNINYIKDIIDNPSQSKLSNEIIGIKEIFEKSLSVNKNLNQGDIITFDDLESKKPKNKGIDANNYHQVIGKKLVRNKRKNDFLDKGDIE